MACRVLVPLDGSERSFGALERALDLLRALPGLEVTLLNVMQEGFESAPEHVVEETDRDEKDELFPTEASSRRMLQRGAELCAKRGLAARLAVVRGKVADEIVRASGDHDVVVMHGLDRSGLREKLRFSQTERIARNARCSVLLVQDGAVPSALK